MGRNEALKAKEAMWKQATDYFKEKFGIKRMTTGLFRRAFRSSIYSHHQGKRECARRLR